MADEQGKDYRSQPRWSAGKKTEVVLRLLRGESLEELSRELKVGFVLAWSRWRRRHQTRARRAHYQRQQQQLRPD